MVTSELLDRDLKQFRREQKTREKQRRQEQKAEAEKRMAALGTSGIGEVLAILRAPDTPEEIRCECLLAIGCLRARAGMEDALRILATSSDKTTVYAAERAIIDIGSKSATRPLMRIAAQNKSMEKQHAAVYALWFLWDPRSRHLLRKIVDSPDSDVRVRGLAAEALGGFKDSLPFLLSHIEDPSPDVRCGALYGIALITRAPEVLAKCEFLLHDDAQVVAGGLALSHHAERVLHPESWDDLPDEAAHNTPSRS